MKGEKEKSIKMGELRVAYYGVLIKPQPRNQWLKICPNFHLVLESFENLTQNERPSWHRKYVILSWENIGDATNYSCCKRGRQVQNTTWIMIYTHRTDNQLTTLLCPHRKCSWLAVTPARYFAAIFPKVTEFFFLFTKEAIHFVGHFKLANGQQQFWPKLSAKGIAKHKATEYLRKMETKRRLFILPYGFLKPLTIMHRLW